MIYIIEVISKNEWHSWAATDRASAIHRISNAVGIPVGMYWGLAIEALLSQRENLYVYESIASARRAIESHVLPEQVSFLLDVLVGGFEVEVKRSYRLPSSNN